MRPSASVRTWSIRTACLLVALRPGVARADDPPALTPPAEPPALEAPATAPAAVPLPTPPVATPAPASRPAPPARADRPMLALPGVTIPSGRAAPPTAGPLPPSLAPGPDGGLPPLLNPSGRATIPGDSSPSSLPALPSSRFRGRVIESTPNDGPLPPIDVPAPGIPGRRAGTTPPPVGPRRLDEPIQLDPLDERDMKGLDDDIAKEKLRDLPTSLPRRPGLFPNRWTNPFAPRGLMNDTDSAIRAEPRSDPAADAALKRRIEKQATAAVGDRARAVDVRVVGRSVTIQARGVKFLQRRAVRRTLESLPGLSGYRSVVELVD